MRRIEDTRAHETMLKTVEQHTIPYFIHKQIS